MKIDSLGHVAEEMQRADYRRWLFEQHAARKPEKEEEDMLPAEKWDDGME